MTKKSKMVLLVPLLCLVVGGCSKKMLGHGAYETMRNISNTQNADNPNYNPDQIEDYNQYKAKRDHYIEDQKDSKE